MSKKLRKNCLTRVRIRFGYIMHIDSKRLTKEAVEACEVTGINPNDLYEKNLDYFMQTANDPEIAQMRFDHFEKRRKDKLSIVLS